MRLVVHILGYNLMTYLFAWFAPIMPDFRNNVNKKSD